MCFLGPHLLQGLLPAVALVAEGALELLVVGRNALSRLLLLLLLKLLRMLMLLLLQLKLRRVVHHDLCRNGQGSADEAALPVYVLDAHLWKVQKSMLYRDRLKCLYVVW